MSTITTRPTNGVSYGVIHTVTTADASDGTITFDFRNGTNFRYPLVAVVQILNASDVVTMPVDLAITYPANGQVTVTGTLVATSKIRIVVQRASSIV